MGFLVAGHYLNLINRDTDAVVAPADETFEDEGAGSETDPNQIDWGEIAPFLDDDLLNILLVGQDRKPGQSRQRSDAMILVSMNPETQEAAMISFLRDLYVQFPGDYSANRLNAAYAFGGFPLLTETLALNFGLSIDGCFEVDFDGFKEVIDILGGVDISLSAAEARTVGGGAVEGLNHLNGAQALKYARIRYLDSDFGRTERQRKVMTAVFNRARTCSLSQLNAFADKMLPCMTTNMTNAQIMSMILHGYKMMGGVKLTTYHVPEDGAYYNTSIRGMAVLVPDLPLISQQLADYLPLNEEVAPAASDTTDTDAAAEPQQPQEQPQKQSRLKALWQSLWHRK